MKYNLELEKVIKKIKELKVKRILLQLPEGLKPEAFTIINEIESKTKAKCFIWLGSCYGACDLPQGLEKLKIDLIIQFGHSSWPFYSKKSSELKKSG